MAFTTDKRFKKRFDKKPKDQQIGVLKCLAHITEGTHAQALKSKKIGKDGDRDIWYARISRGDRVTFHYEDDGSLVFRNHCFKQDVLRSP